MSGHNQLSSKQKTIVSLIASHSPKVAWRLEWANKLNFKKIADSALVKVSEDYYPRIYNRLRKLDPTLPEMADSQINSIKKCEDAILKIKQQFEQETNNLQKTLRKITIPEVLTIESSRFNAYSLFAKLRVLEKQSDALDNLNITLIKPKIDKTLTRLNIKKLGITRVPEKLINDQEYTQFWKALKEFNCSNNNLSHLNLQGLTALEGLHCENNKIALLNMHGLSALSILNCPSNELTSLNVQGLPALALLNCNYNKLTSLKIQELSALEWLICDNNYITSIHFQGPTALEWLFCNNNQLTSLNIEQLTSLQLLNCEKNQLTSLNVQGLNRLDTVFLGKNHLSSVPNELVAKLGEEWKMKTLETQTTLQRSHAIEPVAAYNENNNPQILTPSYQQNRKHKGDSEKEASKLTQEADKFKKRK